MIGWLVFIALVSQPSSLDGKYSVTERLESSLGDWSVVIDEYRLTPESKKAIEAVYRSTAQLRFRDNLSGRELWSRSWESGSPGVVVKAAKLSIELTRQTVVIAYLIDSEVWLAVAISETVIHNTPDSRASTIQTVLDTPVIRLEKPGSESLTVMSIELQIEGTGDLAIGKASIILEGLQTKRRVERNFSARISERPIQWVAGDKDGGAAR